MTAEEGKVLLLVDCSYQSPIRYDEIECVIQGQSSKDQDMEAFYEEWSVSDDGQSDRIRFVFQVDQEELKVSVESEYSGRINQRSGLCAFWWYKFRGKESMNCDKIVKEKHCRYFSDLCDVMYTCRAF